MSEAERLIDKYLEKKEERESKVHGKGPYGKPAAKDGNKGEPATKTGPDGKDPRNKMM